MRYAYPYELLPQPEGGFTVSFPDVPEAITQGDNEQEAVTMAEDALVTALSFYTERVPSTRNEPNRCRALPRLAAIALLMSPLLSPPSLRFMTRCSQPESRMLLWQGSSAPTKRRCAGFAIRYTRAGSTKSMRRCGRSASG
jgi:predicted RNase H-like HicB family nuclease